MDQVHFVSRFTTGVLEHMAQVEWYPGGLLTFPALSVRRIEERSAVRRE